MKQLLLMRHCKASRDNGDRPDHDRPLNERGRKAALAMGRHLLSQGPIPDLILCSSAARTTETMTLMTGTWPTPPPVQTDYELYLTGRHANLSRIARADDRFSIIMLIGHNPDVEQLALSLARDGRKADMEALRAKFPTGGLAHITLGVDRWADLPTAIGALERFVVPRDLPQDQPPSAD